MRKTIFFIGAVLAAVILTGCVSTVTHYDKDGKITKVEKVTNASRFYDGTNDKSQIILVDAFYVKSDISVTAGESYTPGWTLTFVNGKSAILNLKNNANFTNANGVVDSFFKDIEIGKNGLKQGKK